MGLVAKAIKWLDRLVDDVHQDIDLARVINESSFVE